MNSRDFDWKPLALVPLLALVVLPFIGSPSYLAHAHGGGAGHGHDHLHHCLGSHAGVRPDGRAQLRPRRVHRAGCLCGHQRAGRHGRLDRLGPAVAQPGGRVAGHAGGHGGGRRRGPGVRALHRAAGVWPAPQADPHHHGRHDHWRGTHQGRLGPGADSAAAARGHARLAADRRRRHREIPPGGRGCGPAGVRLYWPGCWRVPRSAC